MSVDGEFKRLTAKDRLCVAVLKAVRENDTAALRRLGFGGFAQYAGRLSELMTASVRGGLDWSPDFAALMQQVNSPVRYAHHLVNECGAAVQTALDERNGLRLRVVQPDYNDGRTKAIVGEAAESDSEHAADNLATQLGTEIKDAGNVFLKQNAEQRSRAGFKVTVERTGGTNCCPWCADRIGRWELKDAPKDVFGVHDKCTCMVEYTNSWGVRSQRLGRSRFVDVNYTPTRLTDGEKRGAGEPKRLTGGENRGTIGLGAKIGGTDFVELHEEPKMIKRIDPNDKKAIQKEIEIFEKWAVNSEIENACVITKAGEVYYCYGVKEYVYPDVDLGEKIRGAIISHNHVRSETKYSFSGLDLSLFSNYELEVLRGIDYKYLYEFTNNPSEVDEAPEDEFSKENEQHTFMIMRAEQYGIGYRRWEHD